MFNKIKFPSWIIKLILVLFILIIGGAGGYFLAHKITSKEKKSLDPYLAFTLEIYDKIQQNYWEKLTDEQLINFYNLALAKLTNQQPSLKSNDKKTLEKEISSAIKNFDQNKKKEFVTQLSDLVLANLQPFGRSRLYSKKEEKALSDNVQNINPEVNQYDILDIDKNASSEAIKSAYETKSSQWNPKTNKSPEAKQKYEQINHAYEVLADQENKKVYDESGSEPTMSWKIIPPDIFYVQLTKFSPTTVEELQRVFTKSNEVSGLNTLILDLRDNIGGLIDGLPYFLGPFIGLDQYAYQFFHQGDKTDFKTKTGWLPDLVKFKKVVILINENTQSSAEVMAAALKKYNVGVLVGTPTKGWGSVEKVFPLDNQITTDETYSIFLVHSLTLREDSQPIEGRGVEPAININNSDWEKQLYDYFYYPNLVKVVKEILFP